MPTISTYFKMMDQFSRPLQRMSNQINTTIVGMERLKRLVESPSRLNIDASNVQRQLAGIQRITQSARVNITFNARDAVKKAQLLRNLIQRQLNGIQARIRVELPASLNVMFANLQRLVLRLTAATRRMSGTGSNTAQLESALQRIAQLEQKILQLQNQINSRSRQAGQTTIGWLNNLKGIVAAYFSIAGAQKLVKLTVGGAMQQQKMRDMFIARTGDDEVGTAMFDKFKAEALAAGQDVNEALKGTLSFFSATQNIGQLSELNKLASRLSAFDSAGNGFGGAAFALKEAMSGDIVSLAERFNMSKTDIRAFKIDELGKAGDMDGFIKAFDQLLEKQKMGEQAFERMMASPVKQAEVLGNNIKSAMADAGGAAVAALMPLITMLNKAFQEGKFQPFFDGLSNGLAIVTDGLVWLVENAMWLSEVIIDNWSNIEPVLAGIAAGAIALAVAFGIQAAATWIATGAAAAFFTTLLTNPITWIVLLIGVVVMAIYKWVQSVGGLKIAWMIVCNALLTAWDWVKIGFMTGVYYVMNLWDALQLSFMTVSTNIQNFMGDMKSGVLVILQNMVNDAIDIINGFITTLNKIPGVSIDLFDQMTFGANAQLENEAAKQARNSDLAQQQDKFKNTMADREAALEAMKSDAKLATAARSAEIAAAQAAKAAKDAAKDAAKENDSTLNVPLADGGNIDKVNKLGKIEDTVDISSEDLKVMRELAEMKSIQNYVTLKPSISFGDTHVRQQSDINTIITHITKKLEQDIASSVDAVYG